MTSSCENASSLPFFYLFFFTFLTSQSFLFFEASVGFYYSNHKPGWNGGALVSVITSCLNLNHVKPKSYNCLLNLDHFHTSVFVLDTQSCIYCIPVMQTEWKLLSGFRGPNNWLKDRRLKKKKKENQ